MLHTPQGLHTAHTNPVARLHQAGRLGVWIQQTP